MISDIIMEEQPTIEACIRENIPDRDTSVQDKYIGLLRSQHVFFQKDLALFTEDDLLNVFRLLLFAARRLKRAQLLMPSAGNSSTSW
jgi:hypothetical protein